VAVSGGECRRRAEARSEAKHAPCVQQPRHGRLDHAQRGADMTVVPRLTAAGDAHEVVAPGADWCRPGEFGGDRVERKKSWPLIGDEALALETACVLALAAYHPAYALDEMLLS
jgi:hypothetical protein